MKRNSRIILYITVALFISKQQSAQDYMLIGIYAEKETGKDYWCLDRNKVEKKPLNDGKEFYAARDDFFKKKKEWSAVYLFTPQKAAIIAEVEVKDWAFNCSFKSAWVAYGITPEKAEEELKRNLLNGNGTKESKYTIVFTWKPESKKITEFNQNMNGVQVTVISQAGSGDKKVLQATFANNTADKTAVVALVNNKGQVLHQPSVIKAGSLQKVTITSEEEFDIFLEFPKTPEEKPSSIIDRVKEWVRDKAIGKPSKGKHFSPACMCIRG